jgi:hypothetical protein
MFLLTETPNCSGIGWIGHWDPNLVHLPLLNWRKVWLHVAHHVAHPHCPLSLHYNCSSFFVPSLHDLYYQFPPPLTINLATNMAETGKYYFRYFKCGKEVRFKDLIRILSVYVL